MNELITLGKKRTILISISILLVSIHTIYFYNVNRPEIETKKLIQQLTRFLLTIGLLIVTYKGKKWGNFFSIVLFSLSIIGALISTTTINNTIISKTPLFIMTFVYSMAVYHFGFSKSFKAFYDYQNSKQL
jgi:hypothetical protein